MLHVNERYVDETRDEKGNVVDYQYKYPENFNFAYDVVDAIAEAEPGRRAMIWCNPCGEEHVFTYGDLKRYSDKTANMLRAKGIVPATDGGWIHFDYVPGESDVRRGSAQVTGRVCVIGSHLAEDALKELFHIG